MPLAQSIRAASVRMLLAVLLTASWVAGPSTAAPQAPVAPEPVDDPAAARRIDTVELLAGSESRNSRHQGILARELARQAVLVAAREDLGLATRDRSLREGGVGLDRPAVGRVLIDVRISFAKSGEATLELVHVAGKERSSLLETTKAFAETETLDYEALAAWCAELSRGEIASALRKIVGNANAPARRTTPSAQATSAEVEPLLRRMTFAAQFAAIRRLHQQTRGRVATAAELAALARGYAHLGVLSELYWHPANAAFKARAMLYAQRLLAANVPPAANAEATSLARATTGYVLALSGLHRAALAQFAEARKSTPLPPWADAAAALCEFDATRLMEIPLDAAEGELSRVCLVTMAEHEAITPEDFDYETNSLLETRLTAAAVELPHCWRIRAAAGRRSFDAAQRDTFDASWYRDLGAIPRLAPDAAEVVKRHAQTDLPADNDAELASRATLVKSLRAADAADRDEPSQSVLATLIEETSFTGALEYAQMLVGGYDRDETKQAVAEFRKTVLPVVEHHPLLPMLDEWLKFATGSRIDFDADKLLRTIDASATTTASFDLLDLGYREPNQGIAGKLHAAILAHADHTYRDLALLAYRYDVEDKAPYVRRLFAASPHAPQAVAGMIRYEWPRVRDRASDWERRYAKDPGVIAMLASRYLAEKRPADARRCFETYLKLTTTRQWASLWAYRHLAETYRAEGDTTRWLSTLEEFLRQEGAAESRGSVQVLIAQHYLKHGDYTQALHYAESVDAYDETDAQIVVAECRAYQHRWLAAEQAFRSVAENDPYRPQVLLWHRYCAQTGYGNLSAARNAVLAYAKSLDEEEDAEALEPDALAGVGHFYLLENEPVTALKWLGRAIEAQKKQNADGAADPRDVLHTALVADQLGKTERRDELLDHVAKSGEMFVVDGRSRKEIVAFAAALAESLAAPARPPLGTTQLDHWIESAPDDDRAALCYFAARVLEAQGRKTEAQAYLRRCVALPTSDATRALAAALLRRRGDEPNDIAIAPANRETRTTGG